MVGWWYVLIARLANLLEMHMRSSDRKELESIDNASTCKTVSSMLSMSGALEIFMAHNGHTA
eukprot:3704429-Amphidinium_carterae.1